MSTKLNWPKSFVVIYDNDMGNDIDDAFAQVMAAQAHAAGRTKLVLSLSSNPNPWSVAAIDALNRYYGVSNCPLGIHFGRVKIALEAYAPIIAGGRWLPREQVMEGVAALRKVLNEAADNSVRIVATGFASNLSGLLRSEANHAGDGIPFTGMELARRKTQFLSIMACDFVASGKPDTREGEFNVVCDIPAMRDVMSDWPTDVIVSDFTIGNRVLVDWPRLKNALKDSNPLKQGYVDYYEGPAKVSRTEPGTIQNRPSWDQTAMLYALEPDGNHFGISEEGVVTIDDKGFSYFRPQAGGRRYYLTFDASHTPEAVSEILLCRYYREPVDVVSPGTPIS